MPEHTDPKRKKLDLDGELGLSRRDLLRRGAVVGGTLLWVAPAIQSLAPAASAQARTQGPSPGNCAACYCWSGAADKSTITKDECNDDGVVLQGRFSHDDCENWCKHGTGYTTGNGAGGGPYQYSEYCSGTNPTPGCDCKTVNDGPPLGVDCA